MKQMFYIEHSFQLKFLEPFILASLKDNNEVTVHCPRELLDYAHSYNVNRVIDNSELDAKILIRKLDFIYKKYAVPINFSSTYYRKFSFHGVSFFQKSLNRILAFRNNHNRRYVSYASALARLGLIPKLFDDYEEIHLCTKLKNTLFFASYSQKLITYQESWDHPQKGPYFFVSKKHYCWPKLFEVTKANQPDIGDVVPMKNVPKFDYINHFQSTRPNKQFNDFIQRYSGQYILYPICTSSTYHNVNKSELRFLEILITLCKKESLPLFIRPYPLAPREDVSTLNIDSDLISIDLRSNFNDGQEVFDENEINYKLYQINNARAVVNIGTTFVFDAAALNRPVVQLRLGSKFGTVSEISDYEHISSFLNNDLTKLMDFEELKDFIVSNIDSLERTKRLREFLNL